MVKSTIKQSGNKIKLNYEADLNRQKAHIDSRAINNEAKKYNRPKPKDASMEFSESLLLNVDAFFDKLKIIDSLPEAEVVKMVEISHLPVLEMVPKIATDPSYSAKLMMILSSNLYISTMTNIVSNRPLDFFHKIYLNRAIYDYMMFKGNSADYATKTLLFTLADTVNMDIFPKIFGIGTFPKDIVSMLCICRYSSDNEFLNVKRVNLTLFNTNMQLSLQDIVDVYQYLFHSSVSKLFEGVMIDVYSKEDLANSTDVQKEIYSTMGLAVLELLNVMPSQSIKIVLSSYAQDYMQFRPAVRFSMKLSDDYYRINNIINELANENIVIP